MCLNVTFTCTLPVLFVSEIINSLFEYDSENFNIYGLMLKSSCGDKKDRKKGDINFRYSAPGNISASFYIVTPLFHPVPIGL